MRKLVYFGDPTCKPCKAFKQTVIEEIQRQTGKVEVILVTEKPSYAQALGVKAIPTTILYDGDKEIKRYTGKFEPTQAIEFLKGGNPFDESNGE